MARTEPSNISQCVAPSITSRASSLTKDQLQRSDEIKTEFTSREGTYKISALIDNLGKLGTNTCLNEPVKITLLTRLQSVSDPNSSTSSRRSSAGNNHANAHEHSLEHNRSSLSNGVETSAANGNLLFTDILAFNVGRELVVHEFAEATQVSVQRRSRKGQTSPLFPSSQISANPLIIVSTSKIINRPAMISPNTPTPMFSTFSLAFPKVKSSTSTCKPKNKKSSTKG